MHVEERSTAVERHADFASMMVVTEGDGKVGRNGSAAGGCVQIHAGILDQAYVDAPAGGVKTAFLQRLSDERRCHGTAGSGGVNGSRDLARFDPAARCVGLDAAGNIVNR